jgi:hypothetical protein
LSDIIHRIALLAGFNYVIDRELHGSTTASLLRHISFIDTNNDEVHIMEIYKLFIRYL